MDEPDVDPQRRPDAGGAARPRGGRRTLRWVGLLVLAWVLLAAGLTASAGLRAREGLSAVQDLRQVAGGELSTTLGSVGGANDDVAEETAAQRLEAAADAFADAHGRLDSPVVKPFWFVPVLGRQLRSAAALSEAASTTTSAAAGAVGELEEVLTSSTATRGSRLEGVRHSEEVLTRLRADLADLDLGPTDGLLGPLAEAHDRFALEYLRVMETLEETTTALVGVDDFLTGPTRYLLLAANNAEMRAGSGMILQVGPLQVDEGVFGVDDFRPTQDMVLAAPATPLDPDIESLWGSLLPAQEWRNLNLSPRFDQTAATAAAMWKATTGEQVDGVIAVDVTAVKQLLEVTGPVTLASGETVDAQNVVQDLLVDQYVEFGEDSDARRERLGTVARAAFDALNERPLSASELFGVLQTSGEGRNLMVWSPHPAQQRAWDALGAGGIPTADSMLLSVLNRGGNKLDPYLAIRSDVEESAADDLRHVAVDVTIDNTAPADLPRYVSGPYPGTDLDVGEYKGIVSLTVPGGAGNLSVSGGTPAAIGQDGPTRVVATEVRVPAGTTASVRIEFDLPTSWPAVTVLASGRIPPTRWTAGQRSWTDDVPYRLEFTTPE